MSAIAMSQDQIRAIEETIAKEQGKLFNFIKKRVPREEDAEDILQDVYVQLINAYSNVGSIDKVASWMYTVARNKITDSYRKKKPELLNDKQIAGKDEEVLFLQDILPDLSSEPEDLLLKDVIWEAIQEALDELPEEQRQVFVWHEFDDKSFKEIAEITGATENTLFSRKRYALLHLRKRLRDLYEDL